ncbi:phosphoglycolate phosphatase [Aquibium carbonis]|uniref:Phosphoglycolate phosphatase n=1 Tax=Aquibium carbonis TaxID=2495581 RepID=A0A429YK23_9HYPH|nr:phosphoglycolate phosphatase [Aquibium carbonis]RST81796.1 phosphoglycolate phosphatase [Aquibium carbonis]
MPGTTPTIVFDLDGTLVDTADDLIASINHALADEGMRPVDPAWLRPYAGHGGRAMIERVFSLERRLLTPQTTDRLVALFLDHYADTIPGVSKPYDGALAALDRFASIGARLAICTNKPQAFADRLIAALGLLPRFASICGADAFPYRKPDPRHLTGTIRRAGGDPGHALMVGDSRTDVDTARNAGIPVVAVTFGYSDVPVKDLGPSVVIDHLDELTPDLAERLIRAAQG